MDPVSELENALGAELLRAKLLRRDPLKLGGRYVVESILGQGVSGLVVAALDERLNRPVALKLRPAQGDSAMLSEARTLARLDHPNVVRVHDVDVVLTTIDEREFKVWLVSMARIEGRTMRAWLRERPRTAGEILAVCVDVARGLAAAHEAKIVHRDVKPDNIIVRPDGLAQILDFGFAVQATSTHSGVGGLRPAAGTDPYMSPEARLGQTSRKGDQYSLGITLVEALAGSPVPAGRRAPRGVPRAAWTVAQRATSPDPHDRFPDMKTMIGELVRASQAPTSALSAGLVAGLAVVGLAALGLAALLPWRSWLSDSGGARNDLELVDSPPARDAQIDGGGPDAAIARTAPPVAHDAGVPSDGGGRRDGGRCRVPAGGRFVFQTVRTHGGSGRAARGTYTLGLDVRRRELREVSLLRTDPGRDQLDVRAVSFVEGCELHVRAWAETRTYDFWLTVDGNNRVTGRFEATGDPAQPSYGGIVEPATAP